MTSDGLRGLTVTYFDELNLPKQYYQNSTNKVDYTYDAGGNKWSKAATVSGATSTTLYDGTFIYENGSLKKVLTSEGYYDPSAGLYYYYLKDHLGNTRLTFHYSGTTAVVDQEVEYYPFGSLFTENNLDKNKYLYNGKELNDEFFENYDYGARFYDAELGRWHSVDPLAEDYLELSPYGYCANNPIASRDEDGEWINFVVGAIVGAATDYAAQVITNVVENGGEITMDAFTNVDGGSIALSAGTGALGVGIVSGVSKLTKIAKIARIAAKSGTAAKIVNGAANAVGDAASSVAGSVIQGKEVTVEGVATDMMGGVVGRKIGSKLTTKAQSKQKVLNRQVNRTKRLADGSSKQPRIDNAASASQKASNHQNITKTKAAVAGSVSSNAVSKVAGALANPKKENE